MYNMYMNKITCTLKCTCVYMQWQIQHFRKGGSSALTVIAAAGGWFKGRLGGSEGMPPLRNFFDILNAQR